MEVWSWIINIPPGWQSLVISSDPCDGGLPMEKDPFASPKGTFTFHHGRVPNKSLHRSRDMGFDGMGVIWTLNVSPMRRCIHCHYFFAFKFYIFHIFSLTSTAMRRFLCSVSERISPPLLILRWWKLDTVFWHLPSSPLHRQFVMTLHAGLVRAHIPPSSRSNPVVLVRLFSPACERICCHPPIPAIIFWRFSASQWKTECVWKLKEICVKLPDWQLWQTGSISFHAIYTSYLFLSALNAVTYKKILPLNLHLNKSA